MTLSPIDSKRLKVLTPPNSSRRHTRGHHRPDTHHHLPALAVRQRQPLTRSRRRSSRSGSLCSSLPGYGQRRRRRRASRLHARSERLWLWRVRRCARAICYRSAHTGRNRACYATPLCELSNTRSERIQPLWRFGDACRTRGDAGRFRPS